MESLRTKIRTRHVIDEPRLVKWLLTNPVAAWFWLAPRLWIGWKWVQAGERKLLDPDWVHTGVALQADWQRIASAGGAGRSGISFDWYRVVVQWLLEANAHTWAAPVIAWGELLVGVALLLGAFTGVAAFSGALMHWDAALAGSASANPGLFVCIVGLMLAWRVAGYVGLDYFLLPWLGTPWSRAEVPAAPVIDGPGVQTFWATDMDDV